MNTNYGLIVHQLDGPDEIQMAKTLGVTHLRRSLRLDDINLSTLQRMNDAGMKVLLNIYMGRKHPEPFVTDTVKYKTLLHSVLEHYQPEMIVVKNEELNSQFNTGPLQHYVEELNAAVEVAHTYGVKVANGGIGSAQAIYATWQYLLSAGRDDEAEEFQKAMIPENKMKQILRGRSETYNKTLDCHWLLQQYAVSNIDFVNFHWYTPARINEDKSDTTVNEWAIIQVAEHLRAITGKEVITNETGQLNESPSIVTNVLTAMSHAGLEYVIWNSGSDEHDKAYCLYDRHMQLKENGEAFRQFIYESENVL